MSDIRGEQTVRFNRITTVDPTSSDDFAAGYEVGALWLNNGASPRRVFVCADSTNGAAVWVQTTNTIDNTDSPGLYLLGTSLGYSIAGGLPSGEIQYTRIFLLAGLQISAVEVFVDSGGNANRSIRVGLYDQADPGDTQGDPVNRLAQSNSTPTGGVPDGTYFSLPLTSTYTVPESGFYWVAIVVDSASLKLIVTGAVYRENYAPVRRQSVAGATLPATAGSLTNPASAIAFAAATE